MTATPRRPKAPRTEVQTPDRPAVTAPPAMPMRGQLRLDEAQAHLAAAGNALDGWYARRTGEGHNYVRDGHEAIRLIDAATRELYRLRAAMIGEIRVNEDERAVRVDRMIAEFRARRAGELPAMPDGGWEGSR